MEKQFQTMDILVIEFFREKWISNYEFGIQQWNKTLAIINFTINVIVSSSNEIWINCEYLYVWR